MNGNVSPSMLMDLIYQEIEENVAENVCRKCPIVEYIGELRHSIKDMAHDRLASETGVFFSNKKCPCSEDR